MTQYDETILIRATKDQKQRARLGAAASGHNNVSAYIRELIEEDAPTADAIEQS